MHLCVLSLHAPPPTGIIGGKFLERGRIAKPKATEVDPSIYYLADDLYIGSKVEFNCRKFVLISADEYALRYMEKHPEEVSVCVCRDRG